MVLGGKLVILTLVVLFAVCSNVEAGCRYGCRFKCAFYYNGYGWRYGCRLYCGIRCTWGKRSINQDEKVITPFPERFNVYDINKDDGITLNELAKATNTEEHSKATKKAFKLADTDENGSIDCKEFKEAPYLFKHRPICQ